MEDQHTPSTPTPSNEPIRLNLDAIREKLAGKTGKKYWRSLEEVADTAEFQAWVDDEFPNRATLMQINRRDLLKFMGASMALAGLTGCRGVFLPQDKVVPYVKAPEELVLGKPLYYATAVTLAGFATGVLAEQHEGRPTKLEGNPDHPASLGALDSISQAEVLNLYDPDRASNVINRGDVSTWELFQEEARKLLAAQKTKRGSGIRLLTGSITSPTLVALIDQFLVEYPDAQWHRHEAVDRANVYAGADLAFGQVADAVYDFTKAKVVVSLDSDFLSPEANPGSLRYARDFTNGRRVTGIRGEMNRLYSFESSPGLVGAMADHRWPVRAAEVLQVAGYLATLLGIQGAHGQIGGFTCTEADMQALAKDLKSNGGSSIVIAGANQPPEVHALANLINMTLGSVGKTVKYVTPIDASVKAKNLKSLTDDLNANRVELLLMLDTNPVYTAPADFQFGEAMAKAKTKILLAAYPDETAQTVDWLLPIAHSLESWSDARAFDGTTCIIQPLIAPLFDGRSPIEVLGSLLGQPKGGHDLVKNRWAQGAVAGSDFEKAWRRYVHDGIVPGTASAPLAVKAGSKAPTYADKAPENGIEIQFRADTTIFDGRFANNGWLQELPKPLSKLTWDNVAQMSPALAQTLKVVGDDLVSLTLDGRTVTAAVFLQPGQPNNTVTIHLGYGRTKGGAVATVKGDDGGGFNAYEIRASNALHFAQGVEIKPIGGQSHLSTTQGHTPLGGDRIIDERDIIRAGTLAAFNENPKSLKPSDTPDSQEIRDQNLYPDQIFEWNGPQWGMTIDMNTCIGCNACVTACQAENNIAVVGKNQVGRHREMHWLRIDRYYSGDDVNPEVNWQPLACVNCEKAPCEPVCPVAATVHSHEGLNQMVYNRCVGTRYCSNNCPYKVRRFNYLNYSDNQPNFEDKIGAPPLERAFPGPIHSPRGQGIQLLRMISNPDVTVRGRGVMEKCTYCVQRINDARIEAKKDGRDIKEGEVVTACQQACPTHTIVFGNIADADSQVAKLRKDPRSYLLLEELQTRPRTSHLAKLRNPNPEIKVAVKEKTA